MNQKLKFAFATVITLLSVLWICYCVFCGYVYLRGSEYGGSIMWRAGILAGFFLIALTFVFLRVQFIKGTDEKFKKSILKERIYMFGICPILFLWAGYYYSHFFTVHSQSKEAETSFVESVKKARNIFPEYRHYAEARIEDYSNSFYNTGYTKDNKVHVLTTRLLPPTLNQLKEQCTDWIHDVDKNVTVWNPFLLGNIPYVKNGITDWHKKLYEFSEFKMQDERDVAYFDEDRTYIQEVLDGLDKTQQIYSNWHFNFWALLTGLLCYALLIFAYLIQERNNRSTYTLLSNKRYKTFDNQIKITDDGIRNHKDNDEKDGKSSDNGIWKI